MHGPRNSSCLLSGGGGGVGGRGGGEGGGIEGRGGGVRNLTCLAGLRSPARSSAAVGDPPHRSTVECEPFGVVEGDLGGKSG